LLTGANVGKRAMPVNTFYAIFPAFSQI